MAGRTPPRRFRDDNTLGPSRSSTTPRPRPRSPMGEELEPRSASADRVRPPPRQLSTQEALPIARGLQVWVKSLRDTSPTDVSVNSMHEKSLKPKARRKSRKDNILSQSFPGASFDKKRPRVTFAIDDSSTESEGHVDSDRKPPSLPAVDGAAWKKEGGVDEERLQAIVDEAHRLTGLHGRRSTPHSEQPHPRQLPEPVWQREYAALEEFWHSRLQSPERATARVQSARGDLQDHVPSVKQPSEETLYSAHGRGMRRGLLPGDGSGHKGSGHSGGASVDIGHVDDSLRHIEDYASLRDRNTVPSSGGYGQNRHGFANNSVHNNHDPRCPDSGRADIRKEGFGDSSRSKENTSSTFFATTKPYSHQSEAEARVGETFGGNTSRAIASDGYKFAETFELNATEDHTLSCASSRAGGSDVASILGDMRKARISADSLASLPNAAHNQSRPFGSNLPPLVSTVSPTLHPSEEPDEFRSRMNVAPETLETLRIRIAQVESLKLRLTETKLFVEETAISKLDQYLRTRIQDLNALSANLHEALALARALGFPDDDIFLEDHDAVFEADMHQEGPRGTRVHPDDRWRHLRAIAGQCGRVPRISRAEMVLEFKNVLVGGGKGEYLESGVVPDAAAPRGGDSGADASHREAGNLADREALVGAQQQCQKLKEQLRSCEEQIASAKDTCDAKVKSLTEENKRLASRVKELEPCVQHRENLQERILLLEKSSQESLVETRKLSAGLLALNSIISSKLSKVKHIYSMPHITLSDSRTASSARTHANDRPEDDVDDVRLKDSLADEALESPEVIADRLEVVLRLYEEREATLKSEYDRMLMAMKRAQEKELSRVREEKETTTLHVQHKLQTAEEQWRKTAQQQEEVYENKLRDMRQRYEEALAQIPIAVEEERKRYASEVESLRGKMIKQHEQEKESLKKRILDLQKEHENNLKSLSTRQKSEIDMLENGWRARVQVLETELERNKTNALRNHEDMQKWVEQRASMRESEMAERVNQLSRQLEAARDETTHVRNSLSAENERLREENADALARLRASQDEAVERMRQAHHRELERVVNAGRAGLEGLTSEHGAAVDALRKDHAVEMAAVHAKHNALVQAVKDDFHRELRLKEEDHESAMGKLRREHQQQIVAFKREISMLQMELEETRKSVERANAGQRSAREEAAIARETFEYRIKQLEGELAQARAEQGALKVCLTRDADALDKTVDKLRKSHEKYLTQQYEKYEGEISHLRRRLEIAEKAKTAGAVPKNAHSSYADASNVPRSVDFPADTFFAPSNTDAAPNRVVANTHAGAQIQPHTQPQQPQHQHRSMPVDGTDVPPSVLAWSGSLGGIFTESEMEARRAARTRTNNQTTLDDVASDTTTATSEYAYTTTTTNTARANTHPSGDTGKPAGEDDVTGTGTGAGTGTGTGTTSATAAGNTTHLNATSLPKLPGEPDSIASLTTRTDDQDLVGDDSGAPGTIRYPSRHDPGAGDLGSGSGSAGASAASGAVGDQGLGDADAPERRGPMPGAGRTEQRSARAEAKPVAARGEPSVGETVKTHTASENLFVGQRVRDSQERPSQAPRKGTTQGNTRVASSTTPGASAEGVTPAKGLSSARGPQKGLSGAQLLLQGRREARREAPLGPAGARRGPSDTSQAIDSKSDRGDSSESGPLARNDLSSSAEAAPTPPAAMALELSGSTTSAGSGVSCVRCGTTVQGSVGRDGSVTGTCAFHPYLARGAGKYLYSSAWHKCRQEGHTRNDAPCFRAPSHVTLRPRIVTPQSTYPPYKGGGDIALEVSSTSTPILYPDISNKEAEQPRRVYPVPEPYALDESVSSLRRGAREHVSFSDGSFSTYSSLLSSLFDT